MKSHPEFARKGAQGLPTLPNQLARGFHGAGNLHTPVEPGAVDSKNERRRRLLVAVASAELVAALVFLADGQHATKLGTAKRPPVPTHQQPPSGQQPNRSGPAPTTVPTPPTVSPSAAVVSPQPAPSGAQGTTAGATGGGPSNQTPGPPVSSPTTQTTPVVCQTDLPLAGAPQTPYNFMCRQGSVPLTWVTSRIVLYSSGLSPLQSSALQDAIVQWEQYGSFQVVDASSPQGADVTIGDQPLASGERGYTEDGYATVSYRCSPHCAYYHGQIELSSTASLTQTDWVSTILHEFGHVAGLNHVSDKTEVMYPVLTLASPVLFASGDKTGLAILASERGA